MLLTTNLKKIVKALFGIFGLSISRSNSFEGAVADFPPDFEPEFVEIIKKAEPFTLTSTDRLYQLILSVKYLVENDIKGDFVECGVWRGGSVLAMVETLKLLDVGNRSLHLFDTFSSTDIFEGTVSIEEDRPFNSTVEELRLKVEKEKIDLSVDVDDVRDLMSNTGYPSERINFHVGRIEDTLKNSHIESIALLRLDTDWYASTKIQLELLFGKVNINGIIIFDDYGFWEGHKKAVDEFLFKNGLRPLLIRNDSSCRFMIKNFPPAS